jgi:hypothetical protein
MLCSKSSCIARDPVLTSTPEMNFQDFGSSFSLFPFHNGRKNKKEEENHIMQRQSTAGNVELGIRNY